MQFFVEPQSIVRRIWGKSDTVLFIFAGAAAEFALNKAVDWLYFTGKLPADPVGRLFSTVQYAKTIVFSSLNQAEEAIGRMRNIHQAVEQSRGYPIPDWAYRDVLFMLIYYSIASYELLEKKLTPEEKEAVYNVFFRVGTTMGLQALPPTYAGWLPLRNQHLIHNLQKSAYTTDLFMQYKKQLGALRFKILVESQKLLVPGRVKELLHFTGFSFLTPIIPLYKASRLIKMDGVLKNLLLPPRYRDQVRRLDEPQGSY
ncbi:oxygenase MpaB family protein [Niabella drilacis]|uniref:ER-bound oxygenase mpaB/mpaB'/Rubber oxygenase catalytic domain-containing protein n=1 Tax=Niabella drilacis (strain DSM 25811 / CCM 8410 / CCUG 62505 / LMG 26954 / E90) TaxID=1285928 RepID=A0A1G6SES9_NIADE|nr:oxygenase MpaB family protein [Niabella drilacis]SDD15430.1 hypothetical protein SAMN04487894_106204 [Niabella drilacis]